jgi:hypothetical protein
LTSTIQRMAAPAPSRNVRSQTIAARCAGGRSDASRGAFVRDRQDRPIGATPLLRGLASSPARPVAICGHRSLVSRIRRPTKQFGLGPTPRGSPAPPSGNRDRARRRMGTCLYRHQPHGHDLDDHGWPLPLGRAFESQKNRPDRRATGFSKVTDSSDQAWACDFAG